MDDKASVDDGARNAAGQGEVVLARRVAVLEKIVALERRLRQIQEQSRSAPPKMPAHENDDDLTVLHPTTPLLAHPGDDDSTILAAPTVHPPSAMLPLRRSAPSLPDAAVPLALAPGFALFEYRIDSVLGQGGFGITYLATDVHLNV